MGKRLGDAADPLLVSVRSGAKFSMPGMMDTVLNIGLNDDSVQGLAEQAGSDRFAWDSYRRLLQMFGRTVLGVEGFEHALDEAKQAKGVRSDLDLDEADLRDARRPLQGARAGRDRCAVPAGPARPAGAGGPGGVRLLGRRAGRAVPAAGADPRRPRHRRQRLLDGVRQPRHGLRHRRRASPATRAPARRASTATTCRTRRARTSSPASATPSRSPTSRAFDKASYDELLRHDGDARAALPRPVRHRVHHRARQAVDAADPGRQAHRRRGVPHRHAARRRGPDQPRTRRSTGSPAPSWPG